MSNLIFGAKDGETLAGNYFDHSLEPGQRLIFFGKDLEIIKTLLSKYKVTKFAFSGFAANIYTGSFSSNNPEMYDSTNLMHQGWGKTTLDHLAPSGFGLLVKALNLANDAVFCGVHVQEKVSGEHAAGIKFLKNQNSCALHGGFHNKGAGKGPSEHIVKDNFELKDVYDLIKDKVAGKQ